MKIKNIAKMIVYYAILRHCATIYKQLLDHVLPAKTKARIEVQKSYFYTVF
jgi:hypothetical protein